MFIILDYFVTDLEVCGQSILKTAAFVRDKMIVHYCVSNSSLLAHVLHYLNPVNISSA
jgi:hypothetical protein